MNFGIKIGGPGPDDTEKCPPNNLLMKSGICNTPLYKNKNFLHQKYVVEGLSSRKIAAIIGSSKTAVISNIKKFGLPVIQKRK